jgi:hypothetical protein
MWLRRLTTAWRRQHGAAVGNDDVGFDRSFAVASRFALERGEMM